MERANSNQKVYDGALLMISMLVAREKCRGVHFLEKKGGEG
jgi:hypothetical protein